jgi:DNA polymerase-4
LAQAKRPVLIQPHEVQAFLLTLPVGRIPGVGKVTEARMAKAGIKLVGDIYATKLATLEQEFGSYAQRLYELARGIDHNPVISNRLRKQISAEDTFPDDIPLAECEAHIRRLAEKVWNASKENAREAKTVVLKLKTKEFQSLTRCLTSRGPILNFEVFLNIALALQERVDLSPEQLYRLVGIGLSNFRLEEETLQDRSLADAPLLIAEEIS